MTAAIAAEGLRHDYGRGPVLDGVSLAVGAGEIVGVIGPNGSGKTTLVRLLAGVLKPQAGHVTLGGTRLDALARRDVARQLAVVPQDSALEFPFTALEVVLMGRRARLGPFGFEADADLAAAERAMRDTGVVDLAARPMSELSGGERKRVLLARALAQDTPALVLDEPAAALDVRHQLELFALLDAKKRAGAAVVVVVHDLNLAAQWCDRVALLVAGAPAVVGRVDEVLTPERLGAAFGVEVAVGAHPTTGARVLYPIRGLP